MTVTPSRYVGAGMAERREIVVVGAGPAGLFAAFGILATSSADLLLVDAGRDLEQRRRGSRDAADDLVTGVGGAGLFSDGKLCLSLGVGGELGTITTRDTRERLLRAVAQVFSADHLLNGPSPSSVQSDYGAPTLEFTHYPVFHVGTDHCAERIRAVRDTVRTLGGEIRTQWRLQKVLRRSGGFLLAFENEDGHITHVLSQRVVLALGKVGAKLEERLCRDLGAAATAVPMYVGLRLETDVSSAHPLFRQAEDPKFKLYFADGSKIKTHCAAEGGEVLPLYYGGLPLAGGHADRSRSSGRTSVSVLWNGIRGVVDTFEAAQELMARSAGLAGGRLLAQRLCDLLRSRPSTDRDVSRCQPTTGDWSAGDLRKALPHEFFVRFDALLEALCRTAPALMSDRTVLFAPAVEWWMSRIVTNDHLQTGVPGLYVAGDGAGWSQGIVHAAATGLLVAEDVTGTAFHYERLVRPHCTA